MQRKFWWIFGLIQVTGILGGIEAYFFQEPILWLGSLLLLLPGSLVWLPSIISGHTGNTWPLWMMNVIAVVPNLLLITLSHLWSQATRSQHEPGPNEPLI